MPQRQQQNQQQNRIPLRSAQNSAPSIRPSDRILNLLTGYPLPGEEGSALDVGMAALPFIGPAGRMAGRGFKGLWGLAAHGDELSEAVNAIRPTRSIGSATERYVGDYPTVRGMRVNDVPEDLQIKDLGAHLNAQRQSMQPSIFPSLTPTQSKALAYENEFVPWAGLKKIKAKLGVR